MLKDWRKTAGVTQGEAAHGVGVDQATWSRWESGVLVPGIAGVKRVAALTGHELNDLIEAVEPTRKAS